MGRIETTKVRQLKMVFILGLFLDQIIFVEVVCVCAELN
jgi:hypothetical protein